MTGLPLFAYGTLQDEDILHAVLGRALPEAGRCPGTVGGFACLYYPGRVYPALVARPGASTDGMLIFGLDDRDRAGLDAFEGDEYCLARIEVAAARGLLQAETYLPARTIAPDGPAWTLAEWRRHHKPSVLAGEQALARAARRHSAG